MNETMIDATSENSLKYGCPMCGAVMTQWRFANENNGGRIFHYACGARYMGCKATPLPLDSCPITGRKDKPIAHYGDKTAEQKITKEIGEKAVIDNVVDAVNHINEGMRHLQSPFDAPKTISSTIKITTGEFLVRPPTCIHCKSASVNADRHSTAYGCGTILYEHQGALYETISEKCEEKMLSRTILGRYVSLANDVANLLSLLNLNVVGLGAVPITDTIRKQGDVVLAKARKGLEDGFAFGYDLDDEEPL